MTYKILIVDDSKLARMGVAKVLNALYPDWTRVEAANATEALSMTSQSHADIALVDFNMPGTDGITLAADLIKAKPGMPIAVVSANSQHEVVQNAGAVGATFLPKPVTEESLGAFLTDAIRQLEGKGG